MAARMKGPRRNSLSVANGQLLPEDCLFRGSQDNCLTHALPPPLLLVLVAPPPPRPPPNSYLKEARARVHHGLQGLRLLHRESWGANRNEEQNACASLGSEFSSLQSVVGSPRPAPPT